MYWPTITVEEPRTGKDGTTTLKVELLLGCALLVHRQVFESIGLFDPAFFMYHEEADFLHRAAQKGFPIYYCPFTHIYHRSGYGTLDAPLKKVFWIRRNAIYFFEKASSQSWSLELLLYDISIESSLQSDFAALEESSYDRACGSGRFPSLIDLVSGRWRQEAAKNR